VLTRLPRDLQALRRLRSSLGEVAGRGVSAAWAGMARGEFITDAAVAAGTYRKKGTRWLVAAGVFPPRRAVA
jgi:hypothetical protein